MVSPFPPPPKAARPLPAVPPPPSYRPPLPPSLRQAHSVAAPRLRQRGEAGARSPGPHLRAALEGSVPLSRRRFFFSLVGVVVGWGVEVAEVGEMGGGGCGGWVGSFLASKTSEEVGVPSLCKGFLSYHGKLRKPCVSHITFGFLCGKQASGWDLPVAGQNCSCSCSRTRPGGKKARLQRTSA